jgi:hypothetical protein
MSPNGWAALLLKAADQALYKVTRACGDGVGDT